MRVALAISVALMTGHTVAFAQTYPIKPIRAILATAPGGPLDGVFRPVAQVLGERLGQPLIADNRAGANGVIAMEQCARASGDGYTVCGTAIAVMSVNPWVHAKLPYDQDRDFVAVANLVFADAAMVTSPNASFGTFDEMARFAKANPGKLNWGSAGSGSMPHLYLEAVKQSLNLDITHVPFKAAAAVMQSVMTGEIQLTMLGGAAFFSQIRAGKLKPLTVSLRPVPDLPGVPTLPQAGVDFNVDGWFGVVAPAGTPRDVVSRLNLEIRKILFEPVFRAKFLDTQGYRPIDQTPEQFAEFLRRDREILGRVVRNAKITLDP